MRFAVLLATLLFAGNAAAAIPSAECWIHVLGKPLGSDEVKALRGAFGGDAHWPGPYGTRRLGEISVGWTAKGVDGLSQVIMPTVQRAALMPFGLPVTTPADALIRRFRKAGWKVQNKTTQILATRAGVRWNVAWHDRFKRGRPTSVGIFLLEGKSRPERAAPPRRTCDFASWAAVAEQRDRAPKRASVTRREVRPRPAPAPRPPVRGPSAHASAPQVVVATSRGIRPLDVDRAFRLPPGSIQRYWDNRAKGECRQGDYTWNCTLTSGAQTTQDCRSHAIAAVLATWLHEARKTNGGTRPLSVKVSCAFGRWVRWESKASKTHRLRTDVYVSSSFGYLRSLELEYRR